MTVQIHETHRIFKVYLRYKTITSENVSSEAQVQVNIFLFRKKNVLFSRYSSLCILHHPMIYQICDVMISIGTRDDAFLIYLESQLIKSRNLVN